MADISDILSKLLDRSNLGKVNWTATAYEHAFIAVLGKASLMIQQVDDNDDYDFVLKIHNQDGQEVEELDSDTVEGRLWRDELQKLYAMARRVALGGDSLLEELLKELQTDDSRTSSS